MRPELIARKLLQDSGAVLTNNHFVYTSGRHGDTYVDKAAATRNPLVCSTLGHLLAEAIGLETPVETVVAPAVGAVPLGSWVAYYLTELSSRVVASIYAEKEREQFVLKRGYDRDVAGRRVAVVEDILTTGGSAKAVVEAVRLAGGEVVVVAALCNRGGVTAEDLGAPRLESLISLGLSQWPPADCPLCSQGVPINTEFGHGAEFLARQRA